ncbi:MAG: CBS domain-containing protein [Pseudomonadota bacterium]|nr:CBS domain-containing protein [Pseudomonadota bacterium]
MELISKIRRIPVDEFTTPTPFTVSANTSMEEVSRVMKDHGIRHVPVISGNVPVGIISDRDLKVLGKFPSWSTFIAEDVMSTNPYTVSPETNIDEVAYYMSENKIGSALVQDEAGSIVGIFTATDALNALVEVIRGEA